jgi:hypothetical protein
MAADRAEQRRDPPVAGHAGGRELHEREDQRPIEPLEGGHPLEQTAREPPVLEVHLRDRPPRRPLVDVEARDLRLDRGHDLDRAAAGSDHGDPLSPKVDVGAPAGGVEGGALEVVEPRDRRDARERELPAGRDQHIRVVAPRGRL